jgi:3-oxoadipate enol-lactonase/4-carboxymuconolactone decarboxylase
MFLQAAGITHHVRLDGPPGAPPLLMLHSLGTAGAVWDAQAAALASSFRVIRPDLRGHGLTEVTPGPYTVELLAGDALAVLDALGVGTAHVAGLSIGGLIAQGLAAQAPERVASLMLCDTALSIPPSETWRERAAMVRAHGTEAAAEAALARWVTDAFRGQPGAAGLRTMLLRTSAEGYAASCEAIAAADLTESTGRLQVPALVLVGEQDAATPLAAARALHEAIRGSSLIVLPGAAHIPTVERPDEVADALRRFLLPDAAGDSYDAGMAVRRAVLGEAWVARASAHASAFDRDFQAFITRVAWGQVWTRPGLTRRERSLLTIALMAALGHHDELRLHVRATRNTGASPEDVSEALIHVAAYAGIPAANSAVRIAKEVLGEHQEGA